MAHHGRDVRDPQGIPNADPNSESPTSPIEQGSTQSTNENTQHTQSNQPIGPGAGQHRGDQRDRSPTYSGNERHRE